MEKREENIKDRVWYVLVFRNKYGKQHTVCEFGRGGRGGSSAVEKKFREKMGKKLDGFELICDIRLEDQGETGWAHVDGYSNQLVFGEERIK